MYTGSLDPVSNRAGWTFIREVVDSDANDEPIDLSNCSITFEVRDPECRRTILSGTTDNGKVTVIDTGVFQAAFTAEDMRSLCAKQYEVGCTITNGAEQPAQFIIGELPVLDGVVK